MIKNIVGLFVGQDSKKRQMGMIAGSIAIGLYMLGYIDNEQFNAGGGGYDNYFGLGRCCFFCETY